MTKLYKQKQKTRNTRPFSHWNPEHLKILSNAINLHSTGKRGSTQKLIDLYEAEKTYNLLLAFYPQDITLLHMLGMVAVHKGNIEEGISQIDKALAINPNYVQALCDRGLALTELAKYSEAISSYDKAILLDPNNRIANHSKGLLKLLLGEFQEGWKLNEWRWKNPDIRAFKVPNRPLWLGKESLKGKTILLYAEQGLGDIIQLCRYVPLVASVGARVAFAAPKALTGILSSLKGVSDLATEESPIPDSDYRCPLFSLPLAFNTTLENIPAHVPYLYPDPQRQELWKQKLGIQQKPRIGLVWSGGAGHKNDHNRSISLENFLPILSEPFEYHCLQKEYRPADEKLLAETMQIITHHHEINDFSDTAALIAEMDLVITVDTSVAHLAGAIGKSVWLFVPFVPDFRWLLDRNDSPWYPTVRLFRQAKLGNWDTPIEEVCHELKRYFL